MANIVVCIDSLTDEFNIDDVIYLLTPKNQLETLLANNAALADRVREYDADIAELRKVIIDILKLLGIADETGKIKASIVSGEESYTKNIGKALMGLVPLLMGGKSSRSKLEEKFQSIKGIIPIAQKHAGV